MQDDRIYQGNAHLRKHGFVFHQYDILVVFGIFVRRGDILRISILETKLKFNNKNIWKFID